MHDKARCMQMSYILVCVSAENPWTCPTKTRVNQKMLQKTCERGKQIEPFIHYVSGQLACSITEVTLNLPNCEARILHDPCSFIARHKTSGTTWQSPR